MYKKKILKLISRAVLSIRHEAVLGQVTNVFTYVEMYAHNPCDSRTISLMNGSEFITVG